MFGKECIFSFLFFLICVLITVIYMAYIFPVGVFVYCMEALLQNII
jgi:hypothetical protein